MPPTERAAFMVPSPSGPHAEHVARQTGQERRMREAEHLGAAGEQHEDQDSVRSGGSS